jgi:3-deoxy-D-manno-octulosonate 8-phosphate phosphatase (KDO 8-P phosphatase)
MRDRFRRVLLLAMDVDGVLTDGGLYYTESGEELKRFHVTDGYGLHCVLASGIQVAWITGGRSEAVLHRAERLGVKHVEIDVQDKLTAMNRVCDRLRVPLSETAYVGDDLPDLPVLETVGCPLAVANAMPLVRSAAIYVTERMGGNGAVREICDLLRAARTETA